MENFASAQKARHSAAPAVQKLLERTLRRAARGVELFGQKKARQPAQNGGAVKKSAKALFRPVRPTGLGATVSRRRRRLPRSQSQRGQKATAHRKDSRTKKSPAATYFRASKALSSAQESLTSVFGMGTGIASPPWPPDRINRFNSSNNEGKKREDKGRKKWPDRRREAPFPRGRRHMAKPRGLLVPLGSARRRACACGLSTRYCPGGLRWGRAPWDVSS